MRVLVCGGRDYNDKDNVYDTLNELVVSIGPIEVIIQGGAKGADSLGLAWALAHDIDVLEFKADWLRYGKSAGPIRNQLMIDEGKPDLVVAFPGNRGTADMVSIAHEEGIEVLEIE